MTCKQLRIAFIVTTRRKTGPVCVVNSLCRALSRAGGVSLKVFYFDEGTENVFPDWIPAERIRMWTHIAFSEYDVIHTHMLRSDLYMALHRLAWRRAGCRWVSTIHQETFKNQLSRLGLFCALFWTPVWYVSWLLASGIACVSERIRRQHPYSKARVVYNGIPDMTGAVVEDSDWQRVKSLKQRYKVLGSCAGVVRIKGFEQIVRALPILPDWIWVLVGDGPELNSLRRLAEELKVVDRCVFLGHRNRATDYLSLMDVFILSSRSEGCCQAGLEANAAGLPLALSPLPTFQEIYRQGETCEYFEFDNPDSLASAVRNAFSNRDRYGRESRRVYEKGFTDDIMAENYRKLYEDLMAP